MAIKFEQTSDDGFGNISKIIGDMVDEEPAKLRFNPMQAWMNADKMIESVYTGMGPQGFVAPSPGDLGTYNTPARANVGAETFAASVPDQVQPYAEMLNQPAFGLDSNPLAIRGIPPAPQWNPTNYYSDPMVDPNMGNGDAAALGFPNMPYDATGGPSQGAGYTRPMTPEMAPFGSMDVTGGLTADQAMASGAMPSDGVGAGADEIGQVDEGLSFLPEGDDGTFLGSSSSREVDEARAKALEDSGQTKVDSSKSGTVIQVASQSVDGSNSIGGDPTAIASQDQLNRLGDKVYNPAARKEEYLKRLNTIMMQSFLLDLTSRMMGTKSRADSFVTNALKVLEAEQKFDDEQRLYDITNQVFYPGGVYTPPANKREAFERAIAAGATPAEASAISGYMPDDPKEVGVQEIYRAGKDGVEISHVPEGTPLPNGWTKRYEAANDEYKRNNPSADKDPAEVRTIDEILNGRKAADELRGRAESVTDADEKARLVKQADELDERSDMLEQKALGSRSRPNPTGYFELQFKDAYEKGPYDSVAPTPFYYPGGDKAGQPITKDVLFQMWLKSDQPFQVQEKDAAGNTRLKTIQPWQDTLRTIQSIGAQAYPSEVSMMLLKSDPSPKKIQQFIEVFGADRLPEEYA